MGDRQNLLQPLFAPASQQTSGGVDDIDFNEVFAEYFINEFEDPMNAYTGGMANFSSGDHVLANLAQLSEREQTPAASKSADKVHLPTGGIRTAFHNSQEPPDKKAKCDVLPTPLSAMMGSVTPHGASEQAGSDQINQQPETGLSNAHIGTAGVHGLSSTNSGLRFAKGISLRGSVSVPTPAAAPPLPPNDLSNVPMMAPSFLQIVSNPLLSHFQAAFQQQQQPQIDGCQQLPGQLASSPAAFQQQQFQQNFAVHQLQAAAIAASAPAVQLPVGVGIRLGGVGGVAPSTAQTGGAIQYKHTTPWSAATGTDNESGGEVSDKTLAERRERNREHAKRSRVRKKFMLESLQEQVRGLQQENKGLRMLVQEHIPDKAVQIFAECCSQNVLFADDAGKDPHQSATQNAQENLDRKDFALMRALSNGQRCFVLSDPKLPDNPIIFASPGFYKLTGYTEKEVLGRNCRFLQGPGTDSKSVEVIRKAIGSGSDMSVCLLNYKADGTPFWNQFFIAALRDSENNIVNFVGVQTEVSPEKAESHLEDKVNAVLPLQSSRDDRS